MKYETECTDTFEGEANYSYVNRATFEAPSNASQAMLVRRAKKMLGLSGARGRTETIGETIIFRPYRSCAVLFINYVEQ